MTEIAIDEPFEADIDPAVLERAADAALQCAGASSDCDLTVVISSDEQLQELNRQYLGIDAPTDVLSFQADELDPETGRRYLGDVIISFPRAQAQAEAAGHAALDELQLLAVHGVLHLLGHDHGAPAEKEEMWALQAQALRRLGCAISSPPQ
jgi:probable rRNA maturation factor